MANATFVPLANVNDWFITNLCTWIGNNYLHVREAMDTQGGWEVWAQLELFFAFRQVQAAANNTVAREVGAIWPNQGDRVDFWFTWNGAADGNGAANGNGNARRNWGVELKCRGRNGGHAKFLTDVLGDFQKCNQQVNRPLGQTVMYAVAISYDTADWAGYDPNIWPNTFRTTIQPPGGGGLQNTYVIWRTFQH
jgi:hypothetical protein